MFVVVKNKLNPIVSPSKKLKFDAVGSFNPSPVTVGKKQYVVYRAISSSISGQMPEQISTLGIAERGEHGVYKNKKQFLVPEYDWERFGCEDPRVVNMDGMYYVFYTALGEFPFRGSGIRVAVAVTKDLQKIKKRQLVTPFNAKAFGLFPEKINGKYYAVVSVDTDSPPVKMLVASFDSMQELLSEQAWKSVYEKKDDYAVELRRSGQDQVEVGAPPIKTKHGWLLIYSHIQNYFGGGHRIFGIEAVLLDLNDPRKVIGRTRGPIIAPQEDYELNGAVPNIVFPTGAEVLGDMLHIYYGAADTHSCTASVHLDDLVNSLCSETRDEYRFKRYFKNPIITPNLLNKWEVGGVFNPAAIDLSGEIHILFRAFSKNATSTMGYASTKNGLDITYRANVPVYVPREEFETKKKPGNSGCEDPRLVKIDKQIFMFYTAYNGIDAPQVAVTSIHEDDFLAKKWRWNKPVLLTPRGVDDKDTCILPEKIKGKWLVLHRIGLNICGDYINSLDFEKDKVNKCIEVLKPRKDMWDSEKIGISAPPLKTPYGWLLTYHGISKNHHTYRTGVALLSLVDPTVVLARSTDPILEPEEPYEKTGVVPNVVFPCGLVLRDGVLYIYYGGADKVVCVATIQLAHILEPLAHSLTLK